jgi:hypothetical protein
LPGKSIYKKKLLISEDFAYPEIEKILLPDERTFNRHKTLFEEQGIDGLAAKTIKALCAWVKKLLG